MENKELAIFEAKQIRRPYNVSNEMWYFSLVDIVAALTESSNPTDYLKKLIKRDSELNTYLELKHEYGYYYVIGFMVLMTFGMVIYFKRKKWF